MSRQGTKRHADAPQASESTSRSEDPPVQEKKLHLDEADEHPAIDPVPSTQSQVREAQTVCSTKLSTVKLEPLACGGRIQTVCKGMESNGTIGPFVEFDNGKTGFLTCAHVVDGNVKASGDKQEVCVYQPSKTDNKTNLCGKVFERRWFTPGAEPSIDAAIVEITPKSRVPKSMNCIAAVKKAVFTSAGIAEGVTFNTGTIGDYKVGSSLYKFGSCSPVLKGKCTGIDKEDSIIYECTGIDKKESSIDGKYTCYMKGLSIIECSGGHKPGDSGAGVYVEKNKDELECVGLFIGARGTNGYFTPIEDVLKQCECKLKQFD